MNIIRCKKCGCFIGWKEHFCKPIIPRFKERVSVKETVLLPNGSKGIKIPIFGGEFSVIDDGDFERVSQWRWQLLTKKHLKYARGHIKIDGKWKSTLMHRYILNLLFSKEIIDHKNGNGLDNRKSNLRIVTNSQNSQNRKINTNNTSGYIGVHYHKGERQKNKWHVQISIAGTNKHLGSFATKEEAIKIRKEAERKYYGEFGRTYPSNDCPVLAVQSDKS